MNYLHHVFFNRVVSLQRKLAKIEKREADETAALENMVHMVEKNLELTTVITFTLLETTALHCLTVREMYKEMIYYSSGYLLFFQQRALRAEATVAKLKEEVTILKVIFMAD